MCNTNEELTSRKVASVRAAAVEISCPVCGPDEDPIPAADGSFMWDRVPECVTCYRCNNTFRVAKKITL